jgi:hypothetical protein
MINAAMRAARGPPRTARALHESATSSLAHSRPPRYLKLAWGGESSALEAPSEIPADADTSLPVG